MFFNKIKKKYKLLKSDPITHYGRTLYRIQALIDFADVKAGDLGGYIECEDNLAHEGDCWVYDEACVSGSARVYGEACVSGSARVYGEACVSGSARVYGEARVYNSARVSDEAMVYGSARVSGSAMACGSAEVYGSAWVSGSAEVYGSAWVSGSAEVYGSARVYGEAMVYNKARVYGSARVYGLAWVYDEAWVYGSACLKNYDQIKNTQNYMVIQGFKYPITVTPMSINIGCMSYTPDMLDKVDKHEEFSDIDMLRMKQIIEITLEKIYEQI